MLSTVWFRSWAWRSVVIYSTSEAQTTQRRQR